MPNIDKFIDNFKSSHPEEITDTFLNYNCYWFAQILEQLFDAEVLYDEDTTHFVALYNNQLYDIRGDVTELYSIENLVYIDEDCTDVYRDLIELNS